jgi:hypothetical protein
MCFVREARETPGAGSPNVSRHNSSGVPAGAVAGHNVSV